MAVTTRTMSNWCHRGTLYADSQSTAETTTDATPRKIAGPTFSKKAEVGMTVDTVGGDIEIDEAGDYLVGVSLSFSGSGGKTYHFDIYIDTTDTDIGLTRKLGASGDVGACSIGPASLTLAAGDVLSVYHSSGDGGSTCTVSDIQLTVTRLS